MPKTPKFSIVVATRNRSQILLRALNSVAAQTFQDFECIVVDDASDTQNIQAHLISDNRFIFLRNEVNLGVSGTRLNGYKVARGEYVVILDDDNLLFPWALERMFVHLSANTSAMGVSGMYLFENGLRMRMNSSQITITPQTYAKGQYANCDMVPALRREAIDEWLSKNQSYFSFDGHPFLTYHMKHKHIYVNEVWGEYLEDAPNRVTKTPKIRPTKDLRTFRNEHEPIFGKTPCIPLDDFLVIQRLRHKFRISEDVLYFQKWLSARGLTFPRVLRIGLLNQLNRSARKKSKITLMSD